MIKTIRPTHVQDIPKVMELYDIARRFMREQGNYGQWINGYPTEAYIKEEMVAGHSFVCENEIEELVGTFCFIIGDDPTYREIYDGRWINNDLYGAVHRVASSGSEKGIAKAVFDWGFTQIPNIRVDTHRDNLVMQRVLEKLEFRYCGIIFVSDGSERLAYHKIV